MEYAGSSDPDHPAWGGRLERDLRRTNIDSNTLNYRSKARLKTQGKPGELFLFERGKGPPGNCRCSKRDFERWLPTRGGQGTSFDEDTKQRCI
jgi:hypothetical protein